MTEKEIRAKYKKTHDRMTAEFYPLKRAGLIDAELQAIFDTSHGKNWDALEAELIAKGFRQPPEPPLAFEPPETGIPEKVEYIEDYLKELQRRQLWVGVQI